MGFCCNFRRQLGTRRCRQLALPFIITAVAVSTMFVYIYAFAFAKDSQFGFTPQLNSRGLSCSAYLKALCMFGVNWHGVGLTPVLHQSLVLTQV